MSPTSSLARAGRPGRALRTMKDRLGATCVVSEAGGGLNGALLRSGLVDELHLMLLPSLVGGLGTPDHLRRRSPAAGHSRPGCGCWTRVSRPTASSRCTTRSNVSLPPPFSATPAPITSEWIARAEFSVDTAIKLRCGALNAIFCPAGLGTGGGTMAENGASDGVVLGLDTAAWAFARQIRPVRPRRRGRERCLTLPRLVSGSPSYVFTGFGIGWPDDAGASDGAAGGRRHHHGVLPAVESGGRGAGPASAGIWRRTRGAG